MKKWYLILFYSLLALGVLHANDRPRDMGIEIGVFNTGKYNAITDVPA
jgi:hypothetical protein